MLTPAISPITGRLVEGGSVLVLPFSGPKDHAHHPDCPGCRKTSSPPVPPPARTDASGCCAVSLISSHLIYPLTAGVVERRGGTTDDFSNSFLHFFSVLLCPLGFRKLQACPLLDIFPPLFLSLPCLPPHFTVPCKMVSARLDERKTCPYHVSLRLYTMVRMTIVVQWACLKQDDVLLSV